MFRVNDSALPILFTYTRSRLLPGMMLTFETLDKQIAIFLMQRYFAENRAICLNAAFEEMRNYTNSFDVYSDNTFSHQMVLAVAQNPLNLQVSFIDGIYVIDSPINVSPVTRIENEDFSAGIEIEISGSAKVGRETFISRLEQAGVKNLTGDYHSSSRSSHRWSLEYDSSVSNFGLELISFKFTSFTQALDEINRMAAILTELRAKGDSSCGIHLHFGKQMLIVDIRDFQRKYLEYNWSRILPSDRLSNSYCTFGFVDIDNRYKACANRNQTVEFRACGGFSKITSLNRWFVFHYELVTGRVQIEEARRLEGVFG